VVPEEGPVEAVTAPSVGQATAVLSVRQASAASPAAARALVEVAEVRVVAEVDSAAEAPVVAAAVPVEAVVVEAVAAVAEDAGKMKTTGNCRSYRDTLWRERE